MVTVITFRGKRKIKFLKSHTLLSPINETELQQTNKQKEKKMLEHFQVFALLNDTELTTVNRGPWPEVYTVLLHRP